MESHGSTLGQPQPLATKPSYFRKKYTSRAGLRQTQNPHVKSKPILTRQRPVCLFRNAYISHEAPRARQLHANLVVDHEDLLQLRQMWQQKLQQLKSDHDMLSSMASLTEEQVANVEPLLDNTTLQQPTSADAATSQVSATSPSPNHDSSIPPSLPTMHPVSLPVPPTGSIDPRDVVSGHHEIPSELLHIMQEIFGPSNGMEKEELQETAEETLANDDYNTSDARDYGFDFLEGDDDIEEEEEDEEEDEEQTRRALTYMLEQFGDTL